MFLTLLHYNITLYQQNSPRFPFEQRTQAGLFFATMSETDKEFFSKEIISVDKQIERLIERGLIITDIDEAKRYLKNISYFRLQGFWWEFQSDKEEHLFQSETTFNDVIQLYTFDRKLRLLLFDAIERIEIAIRINPYRLTFFMCIILIHSDIKYT